jgi:hypothetical protein
LVLVSFWCVDRGMGFHPAPPPLALITDERFDAHVTGGRPLAVGAERKEQVIGSPSSPPCFSVSTPGGRAFFLFP